MDLQDFRKILAYDPETGIFRWKQPGPRRCVGEIAGGPCNGYWRIRLDGGKHYAAHRLAWLFVKGVWPAGHLDHKNGTKDDNRFVNLRDASRSQNMANSKLRKHNTSGFRGVTWHPQTGKWRAEIRKDGKHTHIALCDTPDKAHEAYLTKARELFGDFLPLTGLTAKEYVP